MINLFDRMKKKKRYLFARFVEKENSIIEGLGLTFLLGDNLGVIDCSAGKRLGSPRRRKLEIVEAKGTATHKGLFGNKRACGVARYGYRSGGCHR